MGFLMQAFKISVIILILKRKDPEIVQLANQ